MTDYEITEYDDRFVLEMTGALGYWCITIPRDVDEEYESARDRWVGKQDRSVYTCGLPKKLYGFDVVIEGEQ